MTCTFFTHDRSSGILSELNTFKLKNWRHFLHFWSDKGLKGIVNRALQSGQEGSHKITLTVPVIVEYH